MKVFRSSRSARGRLRAPAVAIGNFDGVHRGHQALFARTLSLARARSGHAVALTFAPHPATFFNPELAPPLITTEAQKLALMASCGLDAVVVEPFDAAFAGLTPREFASDILVGSLGAAEVVVGQGFVFGKKRAGTFETLRQLGRELGFEAHAIETVRSESIVASSTKIREFLLMGRVRGAAVLLGRSYLVEGLVVRGKGRGRTIGIPTANVVSENEILPRVGVYAGRVRFPDRSLREAVISVGTNPTFETAAALSLEVHVLDYSGDLYGRRLGVVFCRRLRDEKRFASARELVRAIHEDIRVARVALREEGTADHLDLDAAG